MDDARYDEFYQIAMDIVETIQAGGGALTNFDVGLPRLADSDQDVDKGSWSTWAHELTLRACSGWQARSSNPRNWRSDHHRLFIEYDRGNDRNRQDSSSSHRAETSCSTADIPSTFNDGSDHNRQSVVAGSSPRPRYQVRGYFSRSSIWASLFILLGEVAAVIVVFR